MATREEIDMRIAKRKVKRIAKRFEISIEDAKQFYFDRKEAKLNGVRLPFYKWKKKHLSFDDTMEGNEVEEGDFDNFFSRSRRKKLKRKLRGVTRGAKGIFSKVNTGLLKRGIGGLKKLRAKKVRYHKALLKKMANPRFMANPRNAMKIASKMKGLMKNLNKLDKRAIKWEQKGLAGLTQGVRGDARSGGRGRRPIGRPNPYYVPNQMFGSQSNQGMFNAPFGFDGYDGEENSFLNADGSGGGIMDKIKKNKWLVIGGAVAFLFLTPMGKNIIKKIS
tara:strand:+ start:3392 stop:4222 length:831 start_codon:yes stop_codon:yes gene_type:complete